MFRQYALYYFRTSRRAHISMGLALMGLVLIVGASSVSAHWKWTPVNAPLPLKGPVVLNVSFVAQTPWEERYHVSLESSLPNRHWDEEEAAPSLPLQYVQVEINGKKVEAYPGEEIDSAKLHKKIFSFSAQPGQQCAVHLRSKPLPTELRAWHPHLVVEVPPTVQLCFLNCKLDCLCCLG